MTLPPPIDLTAVLMTALLNPAVIVVAFWMGRYADQRHKIPVAAFAAALAGSVVIYIAVRLGMRGRRKSGAPRRACSSPSSWQRWCGRISVIVCFRNDKRAVPAAHLALGHGCRAGGAAGVGVRAGAGVPCAADAGDRAAVGADDRPCAQSAEDAGRPLHLRRRRDCLRRERGGREMRPRLRRRPRTAVNARPPAKSLDASGGGVASSAPASPPPGTPSNLARMSRRVAREAMGELSPWRSILPPRGGGAACGANLIACYPRLSKPWHTAPTSAREAATRGAVSWDGRGAA